MKTLTAPIFLTERLLLVLAALVSLFIIFSASTVFAAAVCVTNPEQGLCDIFVTVTPSAYTVSPGGNTNVAFDVSGILQYDLVVIELDEWMIEDGTGAYTNLSDGYWAPYGGTEVINTGALTRSVMVSSFVMNSQGMTDSDSSYITVSSPPSVQLYFQ